MYWDGYILQSDISGNNFSIHLYMAETTPFTQWSVYAYIQIGGRNVFEKVFFVSENSYKYYPSPFNFISDTMVTAKAGEEVKLLLVSMPQNGVAGIRWGTSVESFIEIPADNATYAEEENGKTIATDFTVSQNYPNPFNSTTFISYQIPEGGIVFAAVYDIIGNEIEKLFNGYQPKGKYKLNFTPKNLASGLYIYKIKVNKYVDQKKMVYLK
jgi:hypothetical protein